MEDGAHLCAVPAGRPWLHTEHPSWAQAPEILTGFQRILHAIAQLGLGTTDGVRWRVRGHFWEGDLHLRKAPALGRHTVNSGFLLSLSPLSTSFKNMTTAFLFNHLPRILQDLQEMRP